MEIISDFWLFLVSVILISLSGVMMPGPLFAVTVAKAFKDKAAGILISFGHGIIEFPLIFLIYFGLGQFLASNLTQRVIGLVGGSIMVYMGFRIFKTEKKLNTQDKGFIHGPLVAGVLMTGGNPYFLLWWATIGLSLITNATIFGFAGLLIFAIIHWLCDLFWNTFVAITVFKSRRLFTEKTYNIIFGFCFLILVGFGAMFIISSLL
ncbi:MAG: LysE family transporter [Candidatus Bathyarchaeia archaeon]